MIVGSTRQTLVSASDPAGRGGRPHDIATEEEPASIVLEVAGTVAADIVDSFGGEANGVQVVDHQSRRVQHVTEHGA